MNKIIIRRLRSGSNELYEKILVMHYVKGYYLATYTIPFLAPENTIRESIFNDRNEDYFI